MGIDLRELAKEDIITIIDSFSIVKNSKLKKNQIGLDLQGILKLYGPDSSNTNTFTRKPIKSEQNYKAGEEVYLLQHEQTQFFDISCIDSLLSYEVVDVPKQPESVSDLKIEMNPTNFDIYRSLGASSPFLVKKEDIMRVFKYTIDSNKPTS